MREQTSPSTLNFAVRRCLTCALLVLAVMVPSVVAQGTPLAELNASYAPPTEWMLACEKQVQAAEKGSDQRFLALLLRCLAVFNQNRELSCTFCKDTEAAAQAADKPNVVAAARMIRAEALCDWKGTGQEEYDSAKRLFDPDRALADYAVVFHLAQFEFERLAGQEPSPGPQFAGHDAIMEATDPGLKLIAETFETMVSQDAGMNRERIERLARQAKELDSWAVHVVTQSLMISSDQNPPAEKLVAMIDLLEATERRNASRGVKSAILRAITKLHLECGEYDDACLFVNRLCDTARDLKSNSHLAKALALKIDSEIGHGRLDLAEPVAAELTKLLPKLKSTEPRVAVHRTLLGYAIETNNKSEIYVLSGTLGTTLAEQRKNAEIRKLIYEDLEKLRKQSEQARAENESLTADRNVAVYQKRRYQILTLCGMIIVSVLAGFLYVSRGRVQRTNAQLQEQVESNLRGQKLQEELTERVALAERMESLGALAGGIAHDFNNLLVGVVCNTEVLQMYHTQTPATEKCLNGILKAAETASDLSRKMLAYAGRQPSEKRAADLNELVRPMVSLAQSGLKDCDILFRASDQPAVASVDGTQIEQVVLNLINNAKEAVDDLEGTIEVTIGRERLDEAYSDPHLIGAAAPSGRYVYVEVSDNGCGVASGDMPRIFEPFHSSSPARGRGLGLAVVYGHTNRHDGLIRVRSSVGEGTTFRVLLPECDATPETVSFGSTQFDLPESANILFVDDESIIRDVATRFIRQVNWQITTCNTGREAVEFLRQTDSKPDCICLDVVMPEMDGLEVVRMLGEMNLGIPVIVMSGYSNTNQQEFLDHSCVVDFVAKPFNTEQLLAAISKAISADREDAALAETNATSPVGSKLR